MNCLLAITAIAVSVWVVALLYASNELARDERIRKMYQEGIFKNSSKK